MEYAKAHQFANAADYMQESMKQEAISSKLQPPRKDLASVLNLELAQWKPVQEEEQRYVDAINGCRVDLQQLFSKLDVKPIWGRRKLPRLKSRFIGQYILL